ncbi:MAG: Microtubule-associated protein RP/EB member 1 [Paramarteilia canceri]
MAFRAVNVSSTNINQEPCSRHAALVWINGRMDRKYKKVEELSDGVAYCHIMNILFPNSVPPTKVKLNPKSEVEKIHNLKMLQSAFTKCKVDRDVPISLLAKAKFQDNFEFVQWFKKFCDCNSDAGYSFKSGSPFSQKVIQSPSIRNLKPAKNLSEMESKHSVLKENNLVPKRAASANNFGLIKPKMFDISSDGENFETRPVNTVQKLKEFQSPFNPQKLARSKEMEEQNQNLVSENKTLKQQVDDLQSQLESLKTQPNMAVVDKSFDNDGDNWAGPKMMELQSFADDVRKIVQNCPDDSIPKMTLVEVIEDYDCVENVEIF